MRSIKTLLTTALIPAALVMLPTVSQADAIKVGFVTTLTTPAGVIGEDMQNAVNLAVEHLGAKMAGKDLEVIFEDDGFKPEIGKQKTDKLIKKDNVDFVAGYIWSHVLLASSKSVLDSGKILISSNAGPSQLAGKGCHENFFSTSWQNDQTPMAMGEVLNQQGVKSIYVMAPNYAAGKNMVAGVERTFKGEIIGKDLTKWGKDKQLDFSAELAKAKASGAEGLFIFYPGSAGGAFIKQYQQAGLKNILPLYSVFTVDSISLPKFQAANMEGVMGSKSTMFWAPDLDNAANQRFVTDFKAKHGNYPSFYAAQSYDSIMLIDSAMRATGGNTEDTDAIRAAMERADYDSIRGDFMFGNNHLPIQNFYLREVVEDSDGKWTTNVVSTVFENHQDSYAAECSL
ncbi:MAG: branched-chain amino acid transport system substrate-binding protein [Saprospiraceae bacterium]|jgi:branched-chain amino acid transport system substrate-binding protein